MTKHTMGPWGCVYTSNYAHDYRLTNPDGTPLILKIEANDHSEQRANARLIALAPDLLAMLIELTDMEGPQPGTSTWGRNALALIARAKGCA